MQKSRASRRSRPLRERGQTMVIVAVLMVGLIGILALVIDLGNVHAERRRMQNAADAAALAGARALALEQGEDAARAAAHDYAVTRNGAEVCVTTLTTPTVTVVVSRTVSTYFASVIGIPTVPVPARATAGFGVPISWQGDLMPVAVHTSTLVLTGTFQIWDDDKTDTDLAAGKVADGQRGWLNFNGGSLSNDELKDWVANGYDGPVSVGDWVNGDPGTRASALDEMQKVREHTVIIVPIYDTTRPGVNGNGALDYHVVAFAALYVERVKDTGNPKLIEGHFVKYVSAQEWGPGPDTGVRVVRLIE